MRVVHLTTVHIPFDVRIFYKECRTLAAAGYDVHLLVTDPPVAERDGVTFHALTKPPSTSRLARVWGRLHHLYAQARALQADLYHFHDPELIPVGAMLKRTGAKVIYDVHEDSPREALSEPFEPVWRRGVKYLVWSAFDTLARATCDAFICVTPTIAANFPPAKTTLVQNFPLLSEFAMREGLPYADRPPVLLFVGGITPIRGLREVVQALALLPASSPLRLLLAGKFQPPEFEAELRALPGWARVDFIGWQSRTELADVLDRVRAGIVTFAPVPNHINAQPNKLFEYMSAGIPVIASDFPRWREIVDGAGSGLLVNPEDPQAIAHAMTVLLDNPNEAAAMGARGRTAVHARYNWEAEAVKLLDVYAGLIGRPA